MNIQKLNEELTKIMEEDEFVISDEVAADIAREDEIAANKAKKRYYLKAANGIEELLEFLEEGMSPSQPEPDEFYNKLVDIFQEINSRALAFD